MTHVTVLASGSSGNCIAVGSKDILLLDCGISPRLVRRRLSDAGLDASRVRAVAITHEHSDHSAGALAFADALGIPLVGTRRTLDAFATGYEFARYVSRNESVELGPFTVENRAVPHDAADPVCYRIRSREGDVGYLTDTGRTSAEHSRFLRGCNTLLLESNHDVDLLQNGSYPPALRERIRGGHGHIDNDAAGRFLCSVATETTRRVILHHLSRANNTPELALATVHSHLARAGVAAPEMLAAPPSGPLGPFAIA